MQFSYELTQPQLNICMSKLLLCLIKARLLYEVACSSSPPPKKKPRHKHHNLDVHGPLEYFRSQNNVTNKFYQNNVNPISKVWKSNKEEGIVYGKFEPL